MTRIILVRHGESLGNCDTEMYNLPDQFNILSLHGVGQCLELSKTIHEHFVEDIYGIHTTVISSRHQRAKLTAEMVMVNHKFHFAPPDLRLNERITDDVGIDTESEEDLLARVKALVKQNHGSLILFTHGNLMKCIDPDKDSVKNCEVRVYERTKLLHMLSRLDN